MQRPLGEFFLWWVCCVLPSLFWIVLVWGLFSQVLKWFHWLASYVYLLNLCPSFYLRRCLSLIFKCVSCVQHEDGFWFCIHSVIGEFKSLLLRVRSSVLILVILFVLLCFPFFWFAVLGFFNLHIFLVVVTSSDWSFPSSTFCKTEFIDIP